MNTLEVLSHIAREHLDISQFSLITFPQQRMVQFSLKPWDKREQDLFEKAIDMQKRTGLPFWNSIMLGTFNNEAYSSSLLKAALHHNVIDNMMMVDREEVCTGIKIGCDDNRRWAINSKVVMTDGSIRHIPMIDFHIPASQQNLYVISDVCDVLGLKDGFILESGASYHYIGKNMMTEEELMLLLINALLFSPIVDGAWISHQLKEKSCSLRIDKKNGLETKVVKIV